MSRTLNSKEKEEILSLTHDDITLDLLKDYFAFRGNPAKSRFLPNDKVELNKGEFFNDEFIVTTIGRIIVNKFVLDNDILTYLKFQNYTINQSTYESLDKQIINLVFEKKISIERIYRYFDDLNWIAYAPTFFIVPSLNTEMYLVPPKVKKRKAELEKEYADAIANGDVIKFNEVQDELLKLAKEEVKDIPGYMLYDSGARGSFGNNYKNSVIMRGGIKDFTDPNNFNISMNSLVDGIEKEDFDKFANILTAGTYARAKNTEKGGYIGKQLQSAFQHIMLDEEGSDCGTKQLLEVEITKDYIEKGLFLFRYIVDKGKEIVLNNNNINNYLGKKVKMRSPIYCTGDKFCNKCAGDLFYKMEINNTGLVANKIGTTLMQYSLKQFHDSSIKVGNIDYEKYIHKI